MTAKLAVFCCFVSVAACAGPATRAATGISPGADPYGRYPFTAEIASGQRLTGTIDIGPDTLIARPAGLECRVSPGQPGSGQLAYDCDLPGTSGVSLVIDRRSPLRRSQWVQSTQVSKKREICTQWRTWENGARTCEMSTPEEYFELVKKQGPLVVQS
jgi:hypothetical protein